MVIPVQLLLYPAPCQNQPVSHAVNANNLLLNALVARKQNTLWNILSLFFGRRPLPFGGSHLRLPSGPAGIRTTTGSLSALAIPMPYQLSHRVAFGISFPLPLDLSGKSSLMQQVFRLVHVFAEYERLGAKLIEDLNTAILMRCATGQLKVWLQLQVNELTNYAKVREMVLLLMPQRQSGQNRWF